MKRPWILHPVLFAIIPILFLFAYNIKEVSAGEIVIPMAISVSLACILWVFLNFILKDCQKAGLIVTFCLLLFFTYGHFFELVCDKAIAGVIVGRHRYFVSLWMVFLIAGLFFILKRRKGLDNFTAILNVCAVSLVLISLVNIVVYEIKTRSVLHGDKDAKIEEPSVVKLIKPKISPDIYYIVLDGYASSAVMKEVLDYDNREFLDYLKDKGFYIASQSRSNYGNSGTSMATSLNMAYVDDAESEARPKLSREMIRNNRVLQSLRAIGYRYIQFSSGGLAPTTNNRYADIVYKGGLLESEFETVLVKTSMLRFMLLVTGERKRQRILFTFKKLAQIPDIKEPTFVFAHMLIPHPPYVFDRNGKTVVRSFSMTVWEPKASYLEQTLFLNKKLKAFVDEILSKSEHEPIIVLQGDHGPPFYDSTWGQRSAILNAYYIPGGGDIGLYESITPVNSFRVIFNHCFDAGLKLLPDKVDRDSFYSKAGM